MYTKVYDIGVLYILHAEISQDFWSHSIRRRSLNTFLFVYFGELNPIEQSIMVEHVDTKEGPQNGSVHLHEATKLAKPVASDSPALLGHAYEYFKTKTVFPVLFVVAVQSVSTVCDKLHVKEWFGHVDAANVPSTVDMNTVALCLVAAGLACLMYCIIFTPGPVLLLDFSCYKPDDSTMVSKQDYVEKAQRSGFYTDQSLEFQEKVLALSGLGDETYAPPSTLCEPIDRSLKACHAEAEEVIFGVADEIFAQGTVKPQDVSILVVNCSMYSPVPSLSAMVVNRYKMRKDIEVFNLGGMGCSAGLLAVDLARGLLLGRRNSYALVVSTEVISAMLGYSGNQRSMLVGNCLFRTGASGVLLSNRRGTVTYLTFNS